jgi:hypothetical protein
MRVGDRHGERVGGVGAGDARAREQARDHRVDLRLLGIAVADHRFLDQPCGIFSDVDSGARRGHDHDAPRLAEFQRRLRVLVDEHLFDCGQRGRVVGNEGFELRCEV